MSTITAASSISTPTISSCVETVPWLVWANVIASMCISTGLYWDISWHETIGRDSFWTPAHLLIQFGAVLGAFGSAWVIMQTTFGGAILGASYLNRADGEQRLKLQRIVMLMGGFIVIQTMTLKLEYTNRVLLHSGISYMVMGIGTMLLVEGLARVVGHRWARTIMTGIYSAFVLILMWVLPLFPAQPKLGPVYQIGRA